MTDKKIEPAGEEKKEALTPGIAGPLGKAGKEPPPINMQGRKFGEGKKDAEPAAEKAEASDEAILCFEDIFRGVKQLGAKARRKGWRGIMHLECRTDPKGEKSLFLVQESGQPGRAALHNNDLLAQDWEYVK